MNALTTHRPGAGALALLPTNMRDAMEIANMMARAGFFPKELQSPGSCLFVVEQAMRWNMSPYAVATEMSFPQGKPMFSGKLVAAAIQSSGVIHGRLHYDYSGEGPDRTLTVSGTLRGESAPVSVSVRLADAKTSNQHWAKSPDQMLAYYGARVWARRYAPEVMLGVYTPEEFDEAPAPPREVQSVVVEEPKPARPAGDALLPIVSPSDASVKQVPGSKWLPAIQRALGMLEDADAVRAWRQEMGQHLAAVADTDSGKAIEADRMIADRLAELGGREPGEGE